MPDLNLVLLAMVIGMSMAWIIKTTESDGNCGYKDCGHCPYQGVKETVEEKVEEPEKEIITADPVISEKPKQPEVPEPVTEKYRLKSLMNVRKKPSIDSTVLGTKPEGTVVRVLGVENDWLHLASDGYILYGQGKWADKII